MKLLPFVIVVVLLAGLLLLARRTRQRAQLAASAQQERIRVGSEVMTTSGLYGTVTAMRGDDTVLLSIAAGVEVRWAVAALRDVDALPNRYRAGMAGSSGGSAEETADPRTEDPPTRPET